MEFNFLKCAEIYRLYFNTASNKDESFHKGRVFGILYGTVMLINCSEPIT